MNLRLLLPLFLILPHAASAQTLGALKGLTAGRAPSRVFDGGRAPAEVPVPIPDEGEPVPPVAAPAGEAEDPIITVPVVRSGPRKEQFEGWAGKEGAKYGLKWGAGLGALGGLIAGLSLGGLPGLLLGLGIAALGALAGAGAGYLIGKKKAQEING